MERRGLLRGWLGAKRSRERPAGQDGEAGPLLETHDEPVVRLDAAARIADPYALTRR